MFFVLSKILWWLIIPSNIIFLLIIAGWLLVFWKFVAGRRIIGLGIILLYICGTCYLPRLMLGMLENRIPPGEIPSNIDGVIVLVGTVDMESSRRDLIELGEGGDRIIYGTLLAEKYPGARLVIAGGTGSLMQSQNLREADYCKKLSVKLGFDKDRIVIERNSKNTREHPVELSKLVSKKGKWVLVTTALHMPRSVGCFRREGFDVIPYPVDYRIRMPEYNKIKISNFFPTVGNLRTFNIAVHEWIGLIVYRFAGYTDSIFPKEIK